MAGISNRSAVWRGKELGPRLIRQLCECEVNLIIGNAAINHPAKPPQDLNRLQTKGVQVFAVRDDLEARGIESKDCIEGVEMIRTADVAALFEKYEHVWHW